MRSQFRGDVSKYKKFNMPPPISSLYWWSYNLDLDAEAFVVNGTAFFKMDTIPRGDEHSDWIPCMQDDKTGQPFIKPEFQHLSPDIHPEIDDLITPGLGEYRKITPTPRIIDPSEWKLKTEPYSLMATFTRFILGGLLEDSYATMSTTHQFRPDSIPFQVLSKLVLAVAAPGCVISPAWEDIGWLGSVEFDLTSWQSLVDLCFRPSTSDFDQPGGTNFGDSGGTPGSQVDATSERHPLFHRFRNCLIVMTSRLDDDDYFHAWVDMSIQKLRRTTSCFRGTQTALLWSMRHVAVVTVSGSSVAHSRAIPFMKAYQEDTDTFNDACDLLLYYLRPTCIHPEDINKVVAGIPTSITNRSSLKLPFEIITRILEMSDGKTYQSSRFFSKDFRKEWVKYPRLKGFKVLKIVPYDHRSSSLRIDEQSLRDRSIFHVYARRHDSFDERPTRCTLLRSNLLLYSPRVVEPWVTREMFDRMIAGKLELYTSKLSRGLATYMYDYIRLGMSATLSGRECTLVLDE